MVGHNGARRMFDWLYRLRLTGWMWDRDAPADALAGWVTPARHQDSRALDVGCGTGANAALLAERGYQVDAVDFSPVAIARAAARTSALSSGAGRVRLACADALAWPLDRTYDAIVDFGLLHNLSAADRRRHAWRLARQVNPGGELFVMAMAPRWRVGWRALGPYQLSPDAIRRHFEPAFALVDQREIAHYWDDVPRIAALAVGPYRAIAYRFRRRADHRGDAVARADHDAREAEGSAR